ncbi:hypothetical protein NAC44_06675 [Allorhizobium sp. BGMRC 0089]|uniref:hypothetical protein n=1 Tax=Allorhizobium sonneratiae TaxID=2934936 RepID=UPI0020341149|nr:hypothetical protein [Allorhizobium sonneratiae]MCM2292013.1 hypothetical protein [Allorhizobium sonneratiae]
MAVSRRDDTRLDRSVCHLGLVQETKTAGPANALANNDPANDAGARFHGKTYGALSCFGQGVLHGMGKIVAECRVTGQNHALAIL